MRYSDDPSEPLQLITDEKGHNYLYQGFSQSRFQWQNFLITGGFHIQHFDLTDALSFEPRVAVQFKPNQL